MKYNRLGKGCYQLVERHVMKTPVKGFFIEDEFATLHTNGLLELHKFFVWDGATGAFDSFSIMEASAGHDQFCDWINRGMLPEHIQKIVDKFLVDTMEVYWKRQKKSPEFWIRTKAKVLSPFTFLRRKWVYRAVRIYQNNKKRGYHPKIQEVL